MQEHLLDVKDVDGEYFLAVRVWFDRGSDRLYLPQQSAHRLGELHGGDYLLLDGSVTAAADEVEIDGVKVRVWGVPANRLVTRPARGPT